MYGVLQRRSEQCGADMQDRLMLSFDKMFARERDTALGTLFGYWNEKRLGCDRLPYESQFMSKDLLPESAREFTASIDARVSDPFNFVIRDHPGMSDWGNQSNQRLRDLASTMNARSCATEYLACLRLRRPMYHEIDQTVGSNSRHYVRLLLPVLDGSNSVSRLVYAVRAFSATGLKSASTNS